MRKRIVFVFLLIYCFTTNIYSIDAWIRINQLGYLPNAPKKAILLSESAVNLKVFTLHDALTNKEIASFNTIINWGIFQSYQSVHILDFSSLKIQGSYYIKAGLVYSPIVYINSNVYLGSADFLLNYMRQQRCGYNPVLNEFCHQQDGYGVDEVTKPTVNEVSFNPYQSIDKQTSSQASIAALPAERFVDAIGGWHNESSLVKYGSMTANAIYQLLFAYQMNPSSFTDKYNAEGKVGQNKIPDIIDEAKWGIDWLLKMYPSEGVLYHQVADDRDHDVIKKPYQDFIDYGWGQGNGRPVYAATGKPQGLYEYKNKSTGIASIAGKYSSAFAMAADILAPFYPEIVDSLSEKAIDVYEFGKMNPGVSQTVPSKSPHFFEEDNWTDDMELAAILLYRLTYDGKYLYDAANYGRMEPVSPWLCSDTARNYQWYPFVNFGHYMLANVENPRYQKEFLQNLLNGLQRMKLKGIENPFNVGVPMIRYSNNLITALATQCKLYRTLTNDSSFLDMETSLVDWLFGRNPWGKSMIIGLAKCGDTPRYPYSIYAKNAEKMLSGGLIKGPVSKSVYESNDFKQLTKTDPYERYRSDWGVYHDDKVDDVTNEPSMEGTASLTYLLASKQQEGSSNKPSDNNEYTYGGITRTDPEKKQITLVFTGHEYADGYKTISSTLKRLNIKASFFFTGDFYRNPEYKSVIKGLIKDNHYLGANSDKHLLYCSFQDLDSVSVTREEFLKDLRANYLEMEKFGITKDQAPFFLPSYEWYNDSISKWCKEVGIQLINYTPGTLSNFDNTTPDMRENYFSSTEIYKRIIQKSSNDGLNGYILLFHLGADKRRQDKFYTQLYSLLVELSKSGYDFVDIFKATDIIERNVLLESTKKRKRKN